MSFVSLLVLGTGLAFQTPPTVQASDGFRVSSPNQNQAPNPALTPEVRGDIMMARKMFREAIDFYKPGAETSAILANKTGIAYHQLQDLDNAEKYYRRAIKLNSKYPEAINNLGTVYYAKKSYRRAVNQYRNALRITPNSASVLSNLGTAYFARKQYDEAMKTYAQAVAIDPEIFDTHSSQGVMVQERTIEERAGYFYILAKTCAKAGMTDRSLQYMRKALENGFKDKDKFKAEPEFASLQDNMEFQEILAAEYKIL
ncbi:MAG: tetratricopeptide repeat protein [Acidobacteriia bacterium]|jgi:tetratricopeptide (TPR) repeat protein|nr:tetratricopeptide repeat protein [Terriglobia bacterium]